MSGVFVVVVVFIKTRATVKLKGFLLFQVGVSQFILLKDIDFEEASADNPFINIYSTLSTLLSLNLYVGQFFEPGLEIPV